MQTLAALAPFVPLAQTILWVLLVLGLVVWFRLHLRLLLEAVRIRIEQGGGVKAGPFELSELKPQTHEIQKARLESDAQDAIETATPALIPSRLAVRESYLMAEALALRAVQAEFGVAFSRDVSAGDKLNFDAVFIKDRKVYVVEVKLFLGSVTGSKLQENLKRLSEAAWQLAGPSARLLLIIVYKSSDHIYPNAERISKAFAECAVPVELRTYTLPQLQRDYGAL